MAAGTLLVKVADGARKAFTGQTLVSLFDGAQRLVHSAFHPHPNIEFTIPVTDGPADIFRVVVGARDHRDGGQAGVRVKAGKTSVVPAMLVPKRPVPLFQPLASLGMVHPSLPGILGAFLRKRFGSDSEQAYVTLQREIPAALMTLLSIASAFGDLRPPDHPFDFVEALESLEQDRFFARVRPEMPGFLDARRQLFEDASSFLHPGAFGSFKERRYQEGNVQFTFKRIEGTTQLELDSDIDLFRSLASHAALELLPNDVFNPPGRTDPRRAYAMRWMSVERSRAEDHTLAGFDPPFTLERG